jgi:CRISPR-associated protein Cmr4
MKTTMLGFLAESAIHCGAGRSAGIIDLPIAREAATDYPFIAGSGLKGALRDRAGTRGQRPGRSDAEIEVEIGSIFGKQDQAGKLLVADARLLLLPVRCLSGAYRWVTSPLLLERLKRDLARSGIATKLEVPAMGPGSVRAAGAGKLYLEEREFSISGSCPGDVIDAIKPFVLHDGTKQRLAPQIALVSDDELTWFCRYAVPLQARNVLDDAKRSTNLWYEESLPPDTLLYTLVMARDENARRALNTMFDGDPYLQIGGNETVGHGWVAVALRRGAS